MTDVICIRHIPGEISWRKSFHVVIVKWLNAFHIQVIHLAGSVHRYLIKGYFPFSHYPVVVSVDNPGIRCFIISLSGPLIIGTTGTVC